MHPVEKELHYVEYFLKFAELGHQWTTHCFFGGSISGESKQKLTMSLVFH